LISKNIDWLPAGLQISGDLWLNNARITELPDRLKIFRSLYLSTTEITELPEDLQVDKHLDLCDTAITELPNDLQVGLDIWVRSGQKKLIAFIKHSKFADKLIIWE